MNNITLIKYLVIIASAPFWWPFAKAIWEELNEALREDGGLTGDTPTPRQREQIRAEKAMKEDPLVNEPLAHVLNQEGRGRAQTAGSGRAPRGPSGLSAGARRGSSRGFR